MPLPTNVVYHKLIKETINFDRETADKLDHIMQTPTEESYPVDQGLIAVIAAMLEVNATLLSRLNDENTLLLTRLKEIEEKVKQIQS